MILYIKIEPVNLRDYFLYIKALSIYIKAIKSSIIFEMSTLLQSQ